MPEYLVVGAGVGVSADGRKFPRVNVVSARPSSREGCFGMDVDTFDALPEAVDQLRGKVPCLAHLEIDVQRFGKAQMPRVCSADVLGAVGAYEFSDKGFKVKSVPPVK